jgi:arginase family enzyme
MQLFDLLKGFKSKCIFLGGDHSISIPAVKSIDGIGAVISIDAHTDLRDTYMGNRFSNACAMRRIGEIVGFDNLVEIGVRSSSSDEYEFMRDNDKIEVYDLHAFRERGIEWIVNKIEHSRIYLSIDMDVLDASLAMGVSSVEPDGLSTNDLIRLVRRIVEEKEVIACDIVEVTPIGVMRYIAARMVFELLTSFSL